MDAIITPISAKKAPGPKGNILLGSIPDFVHDPIGTLLKTREQFGDVIELRFGWKPTYVVCHPDGVKQVLQDNQQNYCKGEDYQKMAFLGQGLVTSDGELWRRQRHVMQPAFHRQRVISFAKTMTDATAEMLQEWQLKFLQGEPLNVAAEMVRLTLRIACQTLFSTDVRDKTDAVGQAIITAADYEKQRVYKLINILQWLPTPQNLRYKQAVRFLDEVVLGIVEERRRLGEDKGDLLSMLLEALDEETGKRISDQQVRDEMVTLFFAGHDTPANALSWTWYLLSKYPEVERKLHAEVVEVLGGRTPTFEDLPNLKYTTMVIEEAMRLYPPAWLISRTAIANDEIGGYHIPAGSIIQLAPYVTHRHPDFWENPEGFNPERFSPERSANRPRYAYFPFSGGQRGCIGAAFGIMEVKLIVAMVVQAYRLHLVSSHPVELAPSITLRPKHGLLMTLHKQAF
ncbi:MAG: cytochrome P450 [Hassallia sp. WJT32-NPBG1]|jgi:cytochrome P450|nr:cytochrome P450 [Hassallia sp. WJT32-NPBG1]